MFTTGLLPIYAPVNNFIPSAPIFKSSRAICAASFGVPASGNFSSCGKYTGCPPFGKMSPARKIRGPAISPESTRRRSATELLASEPKSQTVVNPHRVSISCMCFSIASAAAVAALFHAASVKCTWLFQNPATIVFPLQSITRACLGTFTSARLPTAAIVPPEIRTVPSRSAPAVADEYTAPPTSASVPSSLPRAANSASHAATSKPKTPKPRRIMQTPLFPYPSTAATRLSLLRQPVKSLDSSEKRKLFVGAHGAASRVRPLKMTCASCVSTRHAFRLFACRQPSLPLMISGLYPRKTLRPGRPRRFSPGSARPFS